jgi:hypothetical protein
VPHPRKNDDVARTFVFFEGYKNAAGRTLSMKKREEPQCITEPQHVEGYTGELGRRELNSERLNRSV